MLYLSLFWIVFQMHELFFLVENQMQEEATTSNKSFILDKDISIHNAHLYYIYFKILNIVTDLLDF